MKLSFSQDLKKQDIYATGTELCTVLGMNRSNDGKRITNRSEDEEQYIVTIHNPVLVTDNHKIAQLNPMTRDKIFKLYESSVRITEYDGTILRFNQNQFPGVWGPSIDTLFDCRSLGKVDMSAMKKCLEVGSGSGYISKYLLEHYPSIEKMTLIDFDEDAIKFSKTAIQDKRATFFSGDAVEFLEGKKYDLIITNPPYIPRPKSIDDNPYEGLNLMAFLISNARQILKPGGKILANLSNLSESITTPLCEAFDLRSKRIDTMRVPLKVPPITSDSTWMSYLHEKGLKKQLVEGYLYWQDISFFEMTV